MSGPAPEGLPAATGVEAAAAARAAGAPPRTLRLASFNLLSGRSLHDGLADPARLAEVLGSIDADLLAVQEVDRGQDRSGGVDQAELAAAAIGATHTRYVETVRGTPGDGGWQPAAPAERHGGPGYGIALVSRLPVAQWHELRLRPARGRYPIAVPSRPPRFLWLRDEPRAAVAAVLLEPRITIACTHLSFVPGVSAWQLRRVRRWLETLPGPHVLLGDLNMPPRLVRRVTGWTPLVSAPTFPSPAPKLQLDHVLAGGLPDGSAARGEARELAISDHRAVLVELDLPGDPAG